MRGNRIRKVVSIMSKVVRKTTHACLEVDLNVDLELDFKSVKNEDLIGFFSPFLHTGLEIQNLDWISGFYPAMHPTSRKFDRLHRCTTRLENTLDPIQQQYSRT